MVMGMNKLFELFEAERPLIPDTNAEYYIGYNNGLFMAQSIVLKRDFIEVVRCKNCDWYRQHEDSICVNPKCGKSWYGCPVPPEHFCSYGERKTMDDKKTM